MNKLPNNLVAITVYQPWGWAIFNAGKDIENRPYATLVRGRVAIHTAQRGTQVRYVQAKDYIKAAYSISHSESLHVPERDSVIKGAIIGLVDIVDCVNYHSSPWFMGGYGYLLANPLALPEPIYCMGAEGFWPVSEVDQEKIANQLSITKHNIY